MSTQVCVYLGDKLASYHFGETHPFGPQRHDAFVDEFRRQRLDTLTNICNPVVGKETQLHLFHTENYIEKVKTLSELGQGYLDGGDTPAFSGVFEAGLNVVGTALDAVECIMSGQCRRVFIPIAGLHHARRDSAAGFCVFNDCGIVIEALRKLYGIKRIAYVDIDAHHGDGVFYSFEEDPDLCFVDLHEDGRFLYPGTGAVGETGKGPASGTKLNIPMPMQANDEAFYKVWPGAEKFITSTKPEFILLQCGADSLKGDPITHMAYSSEVHHFAAARLCAIADKYCQGRLLAMGGGGYALENLAQGWNAVVRALIESAGIESTGD